MEEDLINKPNHYHSLARDISVEPIDLCETCGFLLGNAFKYLFRFWLKGNPEQDLKKAVYYLERHLHYVIIGDDTAMLCKPNRHILEYFKDNEFVRAYLSHDNEIDRITAMLELVDHRLAEISILQ